MADKGLLEVMRQLAEDRDFRERFLIDPRTTLAELGVSAEAYQTMVAMIPLLIAAGAGLVDGGGPDPVTGINSIPVGWGRG